MNAGISTRCIACSDKIATKSLFVFLLALVLVGLVLNTKFFITHEEEELASEEMNFPTMIEVPLPSHVPGLEIQVPDLIGSDEDLDNVAYIRAYLSPEVFVEKEEHQPINLNITCDNSTELIESYYHYARVQQGGIYRAPLTCVETFRRSLCPGHTYLEDLRLKSILSNISPYLTYNVLTENDLWMASLALEFKNQARVAYKPNYDNPKIAYLLMSAHSPLFLQISLDHIHNKSHPDTIIYSTYDYNAPKASEYEQVMKNNPDVKVLPTRWLGNWGGISLVYLEVNAWLELLKMEGWDYMINLSDSDGFIVPADVIEQRVKQLNGMSVIECPFTTAYSQGHNDSCTIFDSRYRYNDVWVDCGSSIRAALHPKFEPIYPEYVNPMIKASQWKVFSRSVIEKLVSSQDFWDILFSYRNSLVPDEHVMINAVRRIFPQEPFIYHSIHYKNWSNQDVDEEMVKKALEEGSWFFRKCTKVSEFDMVARVRDGHLEKLDSEQTQAPSD